MKLLVLSVLVHYKRHLAWLSGMSYKIINQNKSCSDCLEQLLLKSTRRRRRKRRRRRISFTLRKTVPICGAGTMLIDTSKMNVEQKKWKGSCQWIVPEKTALSWVLSNLSCSFISIIDWLTGFGQIKSHLFSLGFYCSLSAVTRITVMNCILLQNTYCPSLQASPSLERNHTFCSFEVRLSLWLPSRCFKWDNFFLQMLTLILWNISRYSSWINKAPGN